MTNNPNKPYVHVAMDAPLKKALTTDAERNDRALSAHVRWLLRDAMIAAGLLKK